MSNNELILRLVAVVCSTIATLYGIYKIFDWCNPYTDEKIGGEYTKGYTDIDDKWITTSRYWQVKRTYKNGKTKFTTVKMSL